MDKIILNETPIRTSKNFNVNNIKLSDVCIPEKIEKFNNIEIIGKTSKIQIDEFVDNCNLTYGLGKSFENQINNQANQKLKITIEGNNDKEIQINYKFDNENMNLIENLEIIANRDSKATIIIKYVSENKGEYFHNGIIRLFGKENSIIDIIIVNVMNSDSNNFISIENQCELNSKSKYTVIDFGGKNSITNYYSNLIGKYSDNKINTIYLGKKDQVFDLNYIAELRGKESNVDIDVQGALKDTSKKHFKGTIDFKKGSKKATGDEKEYCMLLSDKAKSLALPILLCSEEDVQGNHSSSAGKIGEKELFYIMSRGFEKKEALKLMVKAKFNKVIENIENESLKNEILEQIDKILD